MQVLICDDEPSIRVLFRNAFERAGAGVVEASDGDECIRAVGESRPDLVVLDLYMPRRDGFSTLAALREQDPGLPVVMVSAIAAVEVLRRGKALGADGCFDKMAFLGRIPSMVTRFSAA
ncbi:MAG TPA: response regulator [Acidimicrobiales bacterium]|nr:response regulator [Acidimicrobiales bacterium]